MYGTTPWPEVMAALATARSNVKHVGEVGCWRPGPALLGNLTLTNTAGRRVRQMHICYQ